VNGSWPNTRFFSEFKTAQNLLYVVLEKGEADFAAYLKERRYKLHPIELRYFWMQMLKAVDAIHAAGMNTPTKLCCFL
jgi:hypothetical protein